MYIIMMLQIAKRLKSRRMFEKIESLLRKGKNPHLGKQTMKTIQMQTETELKALERVLQWYDQLQTLPIPKRVWMECQLALAEGFTNAVRHAHKDLPPSTIIKLEVKVFGDRLRMKIWDYGEPFDLQAQVRESLAKTEVSQLEYVGGKGVLLLQRIADKISYNRTEDGRNCLAIVKHFS